jgi:TolB-like protein/tetratricopeptide (TPR) repeat protein
MSFGGRVDGSVGHHIQEFQIPETSFLDRLKKRKLIQWALAYLAAAWALLEVSGFVADQFQWPAMFGQVLIILAVFGFFLVMVIAWYHGEKGRQWVSGPELLIIALLLLISGGVVSMLRGGGDGADRAPGTPAWAGTDTLPVVAILLCDNFSPNQEDEYLADGIHEEILARLASISSLRSIGRKSVEGFRASPIPVPEIAAQLGAGYVGECSVRKDPGQEAIRFTFQLQDGGTGTQVLAETYDADLTAEGLFDIQADIALQVARVLNAVLTPEEQERVEDRPTASSEAYDYYLRGREYWVRPGYRRTNWQITQEMWERAIELDPEFALARAKLSFLHGRTYFFNYDHSPARLDAQEREASEALRLQHDIPQAHFAQGYVHYVRGNLEGALEHYRLAQAGAPNDAVTAAFTGYALRRLGLWDEWEEIYHRTLELNPRNVDILFNLGANTLNLLRRHEEAIEALDRAIDFAPDFTEAKVRRGWTYADMTGELDTIRATLEALDEEETRSAQIDLAFLERDSERVLALLESVLEPIRIGQVSIRPVHLERAWAYQLKGDTEEALAAFDSARVILEDLLVEDQGDFRVHGALAFVYAGLGRSADAAASAARYVEDCTHCAGGDAFFAPSVESEAAAAVAAAGLIDESLDRLDRILTEPGVLTTALVRLDPRWDPLRQDPRYQTLLEKHERNQTR